MSDELYNFLSNTLGRQCGLNADWISFAWRIGWGDRYICLNEDDDSILVVRRFSEDDQVEDEILHTFDSDQENEVISWLTALSALNALAR
jgi:hypothetical protein